MEARGCDGRAGCDSQEGMGKASKGEHKAGEAREKEPKPAKADKAVRKAARRAEEAAFVPAQERGYTLADAQRVLGAPDAAHEEAVRAGHPDEELQRKGAAVASDRIVEDGERIASQATAILLSQDADVQTAARAAGLTKALVALLVDGLLRLDGTAHQSADQTSAGRTDRQSRTAAIEAATTTGRRLRLEMRERLQQVTRADAALAQQLTTGSRQPTTADGLASQLDTLARLVEGSLGHGDTRVRALASLRGLTTEDVKALRQAAGALRDADQASGRGGSAVGAERQARLDILDGYCLVLLSAVFGALRTMAQRTRKVRRPYWVRLRSQMKDEGEEQPPEEETKTDEG